MHSTPTLRIPGTDIERLASLLADAFEPDRFDEFLLYRLDRRSYNFAGANDRYPTVLRKVIQDANARLWWRDLVREARLALPADPGLVEFGERFELAPQTWNAGADAGADPDATTRVAGRQLELKIKAAQSTVDIGTWRARLGEIEGRVCRVEYPAATAWGTGFLVGPSTVLTNYHVVKAVIEGAVAAAAVALRFDFKVGNDGVSVRAGTVHRLAGDWLLDHSPYSQRDYEVDPPCDPAGDELDYALLRLDGEPGTEPVGGETGDPQPAERGWIELPSDPYDFARQPALYIVQHPAGAPMRVALDSDAVVGVNANHTRVRYTTTTEPGSSGSPCFGPDWQAVALHHSGDPKYSLGQAPDYNQGIPLATIRARLQARGALPETEHGRYELCP
jgi:V8-like Glu-specific endopeptidase